MIFYCLQLGFFQVTTNSAVILLEVSGPNSYTKLVELSMTLYMAFLLRV